MKFNKFILALAALAALMFAPIDHASAQIPGLYVPTALAGGTIVIPANSTNTLITYSLTNGVKNGVSVTNIYGIPGTSSNIVLNVSEYDYAGITLAFTNNIDATNKACGVSILRSYDYGAIYEGSPGFVLTNILLAASAPLGYSVNTNLDIHGVTTLGFNFYNNDALGNSSNVVFRVNLKSPRVQAQPAGISGGTSPGVPITVPNFP